MTPTTMTSKVTELAQLVTKNPNRIRILQTGDIHLCHRRTPTANILRTLNYMFFENESLKDVDLIILAGDVWDALTSQSHADAELSRQWIRLFVEACSQNDVILRVMEGTPDHDRNQSREFILHQTGCDVKYIETLCIERIERLGLDILYIPDEIRINHEEIWKATCEVMAEANLTRVDLAIMHGAFDFHFPPGMNIPAHDTSRYSGLVKHAVLVNHIHKAAHKEKVWGPGSPDRLAHNEEGPKGYHRITLCYPEDRMELQWVENPFAWTYRAINVRGKELNEIIQLAKLTAAGIPPGSWVRLDFGDPTVMSGALHMLRVEFPHVQWEIKNEKKKGVVADKTIYKQERYTGVQITRDNVHGVITSWLRNKQLLGDHQEAMLASLLSTANEGL